MTHLKIPEFYRHRIYGWLASFFRESLRDCNCESGEHKMLLSLWSHLAAVEDDPYSSAQYNWGLEISSLGAGSGAFQTAVAVFMALRYSRGDRITNTIAGESPIFPEVGVHILMNTGCRFARLICLAVLYPNDIPDQFREGITNEDVAEASAWLTTMPGRRDQK